MLRFNVLLALFVLADTQSLLGVNYSFDIDFYTNFNRKKCDHDNIWKLVGYGLLGVEPPFKGSNKAIQAVGESCASSFPIIFIGGTLEFTVYTRKTSKSFKLSLEVLDENDVPITRYIYDGSSQDFKMTWRKIYLKINKHVKGYVQFRGKSLKNELLLIDSFRYSPNDTINYNDNRSKRNVDYDVEDEDEIIFNYKTRTNQYENEIVESSGDDEVGTEVPPPAELPIEEPQERRDFWNPFTISLVSFGGVVIVAISVVGAYHYGKVRARDNAPTPLVDEEPPRTITIPRVNLRSNRSSPLRFYEY